MNSLMTSGAPRWPGPLDPTGCARCPRIQLVRRLLIERDSLGEAWPLGDSEDEAAAGW
jgi:hypothetical protein